MKLKLNDIYIGARARKDYGKAEMEDLKRDLEENGQITPITVRPPREDEKELEDYAGQPWLLVAGGRRLMATAMLGWEEIEAFGREEMDEIKHRQIELSENIKRKAMSWQEEVNAKAEIAALRRLQNPEITDREIAKEIGDNVASFSRDLETARILEKNPGLKNAGSKHAALNAGKMLAEHEARTRRQLSIAESKPETTHIPPVENRIVVAEAIDFARALTPRSIDYGCFDGPYGYNYWKQGQKTAKNNEEADHLSAFDDDPERTGDMYRELFPHLVRAMRETGWMTFFCGKETYDFIEELAQDCCAVHASYRNDQYPTQCDGAVVGALGRGECRFLVPEPYPWIWHRPNSRNQPRYKERHAKNVMELILVINMGKGRLLKQPCHNVLVHDAEYTDRVHVNQKPIPLYRDLIERFTFSGDAVLDTFYGSGNSMGAAASLGRIPWGCDRNPQMQAFARGKAQQYQQIITKDAVQASWDRYQRGLSLELEPDDVGEVEETPGPPVPKMPREGQRYQAGEVMRIPDVGFMAYVYYDAYVMDQVKAETQREAEGRVERLVQQYNDMMDLGIIDPSKMDRDEIKELTGNAEN